MCAIFIITGAWKFVNFNGPVKLWEAFKCKQAYMWVVVGGCEANPPYRIYEFKQDRCTTMFWIY